MASTSVRALRSRPALLLALGLLLAGVLAAGLYPSAAAQTAAKPAVPTAAKGNATAEMVQFINEKLDAVWKANKIKPTEPCNDYEFIRRTSLDIIGRIATPGEVSAYLKDPAATR